MLIPRKLASVVTVAAAVCATQWADSSTAFAAGECGGGWVDNVGGGQQNVGCTEEDTHLSGTGSGGECYGECGRGCAWYRCGGGGCCQTHDYYTRTQGLWSGAAMSIFPCAIVQWGSCITGLGSRGGSTYEVSKATGAGGTNGARVNP